MEFRTVIGGVEDGWITVGDLQDVCLFPVLNNNMLRVRDDGARHTWVWRGDVRMGIVEYRIVM